MLDTHADIVNVIGLDFYDNLNYGKSNYLVPGKENRDFTRDFWKPEDMQENVRRLVNGKPNVQVNLNLGSAAFTVYTCDFTHDYIDINADYRN